MSKRILLVLLGWLAAVLAVAAIASLAIDTAGRQVITAPVTASYRVSAAPSVTPATEVPTVRPTTSEPNLTARPNSTRTAPSKRGKSHPNAVLPTSSPTPSPVLGSYSTLAGRVRVTCTGARITLAGGYAQPAADWAVTIRESGPDRIRVQFERDRHRDLVVVATCGSGRPQFEQSRAEDRRRDRHRHSGGSGGGMFRDFGGSSDQGQD